MKSPRPTVTRASLADALISCGVNEGDTILVHSDLFAMGPVRGHRQDILQMYFDAFQDALGTKGTVVVPAFSYEYGRFGTPFDINKSPLSPELGVFAQFVASQPGALRSPNPITALAAVGPRAEYLCRGGTASSFGVDSPWDRLLECDGKMLFMGVDIGMMTFVHYVENRVGVPHLYTKLYTVPVYDNNRVINLPVSAQVRYLEFGIEPDLKRFVREYEATGRVREATVGTGKIHCVSTRHVFEFLKTKLQQDHAYLLKHPPRFVQGAKPMDGPTGPKNV